MSQFPYDEFSKQIAEVSLELAGVDKTVPGETREIDFYFVPSFSPSGLGAIGLLRKLPLCPMVGQKP
jgi:hypothetical protein